ncbi:cold shock domain-containing protein [Dankookia sp. P2]|uniref:cold shock domain-containing protein n=1 Tax=Dankookia sp. P2 TaxID=3423955 RepID=UPI003D6688E8
MPSDNDMQGGTGPVEAQVKWYNARKGFGFVLGPDGQDVFFHASALTEAGIEPPDTGDTLVCEIGTDRQGRRLVTRISELRRGEGGGAAGMAPRRPPFGAAGGNYGGGGFGDRPPRRDFGGGGFGDRPPRRDFGGGGFGDRPPRQGRVVASAAASARPARAASVAAMATVRRGATSATATPAARPMRSAAR